MTTCRYTVRVLPMMAFVSFALALAAPGAWGSSPHVIVEEVPLSPAAPAVDGCNISNGVLLNLAYSWDTPDGWHQMATLIRPSSCTGCPAPAMLHVQSVSFRMAWFSACDASVEISIVGTDDDPLCPQPDFGQVLCPPFVHELSGAPGERTTYTVPLPEECCLEGDAFVVLTFQGLGDCPDVTSPAIYASAAACTTCSQYLSTLVTHPDLTESCDIVNQQLWLGVNGICCEPVQAQGSSWGRVKSLYR